MAWQTTRKHQAVNSITSRQQSNERTKLQAQSFEPLSSTLEREHETGSHKIFMDSGIYELLFFKPPQMLLDSTFQICSRYNMSRSGLVRCLKVPVSNRFIQKSESRKYRNGSASRVRQPKGPLGIENHGP